MDREIHIRFLRDMLRARRMEERLAEEYTQGRVGGFMHLYPGEEAVAVGVLHAAEPGDYIVSTYREHVHALVRGIPMRAIIAELFGKQEGCCRGMGGSMHLFDAERRFLGGYAIVGETYPIAIGAAYTIRLRERPEAVICFFGDGAVNQGTFHESLNMASLWKLPILFVCENNHYQIGTEIHRHSAVTEVYKRACGYDIPAERVNGMEIEAVYDHANEALHRIRTGQGPQFIEFETYRYRGHSMSDPATYRPNVELTAWKAEDPIAMELRSMHLQYPDESTLHQLGLDTNQSIAQKWIDAGHLDAQGLDRLMADIDHEIEDAVQFAVDAPEPDLEQAQALMNPSLLKETLI